MLAVVGAGYWGMNHVRNFQDLGALGAICDTSEPVRARLQESYPAVKIHAHLGEVLADPEIKAVVLATPPPDHYHGARSALISGRHVLVEKPMALSSEEANELTRTAQEKGLVLMVGHLLEYHPAFVALKELIAAGELGQLTYLYSHRVGPGKIRQEENVLWNLAPHDFSMILRLLGRMPDFVRASGSARVTPGIEDSVVAWLSFPGELRAHVFVSWLHPFKERRLVVVGAEKTAVFDDMVKEGKLKLYPGPVVWQNQQPVAVAGEAELVPYEPVEPLRAECEHFLRCLEAGEQPLTDGASGAQVTRMLEACQSSLKSDGGTIACAGREEPREYFVHPTAVIDDGCEIGPGTRIWHFTHVLSNSRIGADCVIGQNVCIGPEVNIGRNVKIQNNVSVYKGVTLEDDVFAGPSCVFTNVLNPRSHVSRKHEFRETRVGRGATIGANATIICGHTIGRYALVGAGSVVTKDVPDYAIVFGNPARLRGWVCNCGEKLDFEGTERAACGRCSREYRRHGEVVSEIER